MLAKEIREKYLKFFESKGHKIIPSASLVPELDPTVLFTTAGMHPLVPYLLGEKHPLGHRLVDSQKCIRTGDIDDVGDNTHNTFFEMLGNWSLGDYFKKEAIEWSFEFLTKELNIPIERLAVSVFEGEEGIEKDEESAGIWKSLGIPEKRIQYLNREENWWGPAGKTGPCGPDTEMFYYVGDNVPESFDPKDDGWIEIWNDVFMEYNKTEDGKYVPLEKKNVDTGMGLERITFILQEKDNVFETELFTPIIKKIRELAKKENKESERIIADHIKAATFILAEKVVPSNTERGYILRRLIRRAVRHAKLLGIEGNFTASLSKIVTEIYKGVYPEIDQDFILRELEKEEEAFSKTLERGLKELRKLNMVGKFGLVEDGQTPDTINKVDAEKAFYIYQTFGFPLEMIQEELAKEDKLVLEEEFNKELVKHQDLSRTASAGKFKAGLADDSEMTIKYHTTCHLLLAALREVLGKDVNQMGSNITSERIRFDFSFDRKLTEEEVKQIEEIVNSKIDSSTVTEEEMETEKALESGALGMFRDKYPDKVKVYTILDKDGNVFSKEICSGPHVENTDDLGKFKIIKEKASSSGVRRIKAILE